MAQLSGLAALRRLSEGIQLAHSWIAIENEWEAAFAAPEAYAADGAAKWLEFVAKLDVPEIAPSVADFLAAIEFERRERSGK